MFLSVTQPQRSKGGPAEKVSLKTHATGSTGGEAQKMGIKDRALTVEPLNPKSYLLFLFAHF